MGWAELSFVPLKTTWPTESIARAASIAPPADRTLSERVILAYQSDNWMS